MNGGLHLGLGRRGWPRSSILEFGKDRSQTLLLGVMHPSMIECSWMPTKRDRVDRWCGTTTLVTRNYSKVLICVYAEKNRLSNSFRCHGWLWLLFVLLSFFSAWSMLLFIVVRGCRAQNAAAPWFGRVFLLYLCVHVNFKGIRCVHEHRYCKIWQKLFFFQGNSASLCVWLWLWFYHPSSYLLFSLLLWHGRFISEQNGN